jgi:hypothetical protein
MTPAASNRARLIDDADGPGRTTATLVASLAARLGVLHLITGADAIGSLTAGFAKLGREVSKTAKGALLREAIQSGRAGTNGYALWKALGIGKWISLMPPSPVLDQLRNDVALLLADDLESTLELLPIPSHSTGIQNLPELEPATFVDCLLGLWAFSSELVHSVDALADAMLAHSNELTGITTPGPESKSSILR